ncbi:MAG: acetyl-CoA carboxylase carboxyl transferase subunit beta [Micavibrio aeruginosavorus]|uniref:Acetyl-coenzyme A carboxylase carboxyl transferase subunit beta n=1 Tax=Micavibrio aeruginosavorus TaxID=349221 RepID=A0A2W5A8W0_9BACT|nr:MAG: acetyl-CoA carboxylase carboxyl transferase subunit beta [Micavibrio aeruginosavorus]
MNWLTNFIRPRIRSIVGEQKDVPDNLWQKCEACEGMLFHKELKANLNVCYHCGHHLALEVKERLGILFDDGHYERVQTPRVPHDPLKFKDSKKYADRLVTAQKKTKEADAIQIASGTIGGNKAVVAAFDFAFMGGSMGTAVGEGIVKAAETAVQQGAALIVIPASGGARMQEGALSLMQMPRTIIAVNMVKDEGLPYIVLLTNPTTGGVSASFAMVGDIHMAEPGAMIGFAGRRVIEETVRETLPKEFQTAEYLLDHGMVDMVVKRSDLKETIGRVLDLLMMKNRGGAPGSIKAGVVGKLLAGPKGNKGSKPSAGGTVAILKKDAAKVIRKAANAADTKSARKSAGK